MNDATKAQVAAARPHLSTWLTANAGSGKTRVLTERVARLLLSGVDPQRVLCLTYTKAAASEMQNRLFDTLGKWAMLPDGKLAEELAGLGEPGPFPEDVLAAARTLFARAIETPGGLKIQTIHSFCSSILRRFPTEAGVSPDFREMDERLAKLMQNEVLEELALNGDPGLTAMAEYQSGDDLSAWLGELLKEKQALSHPKTQDEIWQAFDLPLGFTLHDLANQCLRPDDFNLLRDVAKSLRASGSNDQKLAAMLSSIPQSPNMASLGTLEDAFVYKGDAKGRPLQSKTDRVPTKDGKKLLGPDLTQQLHGLMDRFEDAMPLRRGLAQAMRTHALHQFARSFLPALEEKKAQGGWLDFDDLIDKTRALLTRDAMAQWVLYKLDGGIDHILVDEAQDTSPNQWQVIRILAEEFLSGQGSREDATRTVFVVGDKKQSIYSFQGADPRAFDEMRDYFDRMLADAPDPMQKRSLEFSFRSAPAVLQVVDRAFEASDHHGLGQDSHHKSFKSELPGRVDLLDPFLPVKSEKPAWNDPLDRVSEADHRRKLAKSVALRIKGMIGTAQIPVIDRDGRHDRVVEPRDILVLVQRRSEIFGEIIRACKDEDVPMAGADRMNIAQELAVRDITAFLSFIATPEDNLSLASILKSPIFGWDERQLFELAHNRDQSFLWAAMRSRADDFPREVALIQDMLNQSDFLRPFELIERLLTKHQARRNIYARLGPEAEDAIDALLSQAMAYEQSDVPSLTGFLTWLQADDLKIKRAIDSSANVVRVMTAHGAKGLEAPIVILPDTADRNAPKTDALATHGDLPIWRTSKGDQTVEIAEAAQLETQRRMEERQRLLYVAMTRAECWLIVAAAGDIKDGGMSWYSQIARGLDGLATKQIDGGIRYEPDPWLQDLATPEHHAGTEPAQLNLPAPPKPEPTEKPLSPSDLGGAKVLQGTDEDPEALMRGIAIHALLEHLPDLPTSNWSAFARKITQDELDANAILAEAQAVITAPQLAPVFADEAMAEVSLTATLDHLNGRRITGTVDRLIVAEDHVLAVDFKSNRMEAETPDQVPDGLLRQMGAYAAALSQIYPDKRVETAILWTRSARLMPLAHQSVIEALQKVTPA